MNASSIASRASLALVAGLLLHCGQPVQPSDAAGADASLTDIGGDALLHDVADAQPTFDTGVAIDGETQEAATTDASGGDALDVAADSAMSADATDNTPIPDTSDSAAAPDAIDVSGADATDALPSDARDAAVVDAADVVITPAERAAFATLMGDAQRELNTSHAPGVSIAVVLHGRLAFSGALGSRNTATGAPVTTATLFRAGSLSKMMLAATAMSLVREGRVDLHAPITQYLPWFQLAPGFDARTITLEHLLTHTSGFPCDTIIQCGNAATRGPRQAFFAGNPQPLWAPPGAQYDYANSGYGLASLVLTSAAGLTDPDYEQLVHDRVFVPAGMTTATYDPVAAMSGDAATGYNLNASGMVTGTFSLSASSCPLIHPSGGVIATPSDYAHFAEALLANGGAVLDAAGVSAMEAPHVNLRNVPTRAYGYGLVHEFSPYPSHASVWHDGQIPGFESVMWMLPDRQFAIVVMANAVGTQSVPFSVLNDALPLFISDTIVPAMLTTSSATWDPYAGTYNDTLGTLGVGVVVSLVPGAGGTRVLQIDAPNATDLLGRALPVHGAMRQVAIDSWALPDGTQATFFPDATGVFRYLSTRRGVAVR